MFVSGDGVILDIVPRGVLFDIVDNGRDAQAAACRGSDGVIIYHNELVCLSHSSLCVTNYVSCERQITLMFRPPVCLIVTGSRKFNLRV